MRKFKTYAIKQGETVGVGIEEFREEVTLAIASIYLPEKPSNRELFETIAQYVLEQIEPEEVAILRYTRPINVKYAWWKRYKRIIAYNEVDAHIPFIQTRKLAEDALNRKSSVCENMTEGITYKAALKGGEIE